MNFTKQIQAVKERVGDVADRLGELFAEFNKEHCASCSDCCCRDCGPTIGYLSTRQCKEPPYPQYEPYIKFLKKTFGYSKKYGFLSTRTGCKLPRYLRSLACLEYICSDKDAGEFKKKLVYNGGVRRKRVRAVAQKMALAISIAQDELVFSVKE